MITKCKTSTYLCITFSWLQCFCIQNPHAPLGWAQTTGTSKVFTPPTDTQSYVCWMYGSSFYPQPAPLTDAGNPAHWHPSSSFISKTINFWPTFFLFIYAPRMTGLPCFPPITLMAFYAWKYSWKDLSPNQHPCGESWQVTIFIYYGNF